MGRLALQGQEWKGSVGAGGSPEKTEILRQERQPNAECQEGALGRSLQLSGGVGVREEQRRASRVSSKLEKWAWSVGHEWGSQQFSIQASHKNHLGNLRKADTQPPTS